MFFREISQLTETLEKEGKRKDGMTRNTPEQKIKKAATLKVTAFAREERLELPTPGFGDQCSTN